MTTSNDFCESCQAAAVSGEGMIHYLSGTYFKGHSTWVSHSFTLGFMLLVFPN